jgi:hypothetical protein
MFPFLGLKTNRYSFLRTNGSNKKKPLVETKGSEILLTVLKITLMDKITSRGSSIIYFAAAVVSIAAAAVSTVVAAAVSTVVAAVSVLASVEAPPQAVNAAIAKIAITFFIWVCFFIN